MLGVGHPHLLCDTLLSIYQIKKHSFFMKITLQSVHTYSQHPVYIIQRTLFLGSHVLLFGFSMMCESAFIDTATN